MCDDIVEQEVAKLLKRGIIRPSKSAWAFPVVLQDKKDGSPRLGIDYRSLNEITIRDAYPLHRIDDIIESLGSAKIFSTLDATSDFNGRTRYSQNTLPNSIRTLRVHQNALWINKCTGSIPKNHEWNIQQ